MNVLTENLVLKRSRAESLEAVKTLNCWGCDLHDVSILHKLPNLEVLNLSCNNLATLNNLQPCQKLRELYLRSNQLSDFTVLQSLTELSSLEVLWLRGNPLSSAPEYRSRVAQLLPQLTQLDNVVVTEEERVGEEEAVSGDLRKVEARGRSNICQAVLCLLPELDQDSLRDVQDRIRELLRD